MIDPRKDYSDAKWARLYKEYQIRYDKASQDYNMHPMYSFSEFRNLYVDIAQERAGGIEKSKIIKDIVRSAEKRETYKIRNVLLDNLKQLKEVESIDPDEVKRLEREAAKITQKEYKERTKGKTEKEIEAIDKEIEIEEMERAQRLHEEVGEFLRKTAYDGSERWARFHAADLRALLETLELGDWSIYFNS